MKYIFAFPFIAILNSLPVKQQGFNVSTKDTVYVYTPVRSHECKFPNCIYRGDLIFFQENNRDISYAFNRMHFYYPEKTAWQHYQTYLKQKQSL